MERVNSKGIQVDCQCQQTPRVWTCISGPRLCKIMKLASFQHAIQTDANFRSGVQFTLSILFVSILFVYMCSRFVVGRLVIKMPLLYAQMDFQL